MAATSATIALREGLVDLGRLDLLGQALDVLGRLLDLGPDVLGHQADPGGRLLEAVQDRPQPRGDGVDGLPDLGDGVAQVAPLDGAQTHLLHDRVEHRGLDALQQLAPGQWHVRAAGRDDVDDRLARQTRLDGDLGVDLQP